MFVTPAQFLGVDTGSDCTLVIGDIHGQWCAAKTLLKAFAFEGVGRRTHLVTLGDVVDKGPKSIKSLQAVLSDTAASLANVDTHTRLWGNHEIMMVEALRALDTPQFNDRMQIWKLSGADRVLDELDVKGSYAKRCHALVNKLGMDALQAFNTWQSHHTSKDLRMVHAGFDPALGWDATMALTPADLWRENPDSPNGMIKRQDHWASVRVPFLAYAGDPGVITIHGHSIPRSLVERRVTSASHLTAALSRLKQHRICLDGGAGKDLGVAGAVIQDGTIRLFYSPV